MEYNRMMEKALADTFGTDLMVSDVDLMVFAEDEIRMSHYDSKDNRANRRRKTALAKKRLQKKKKYAADEILATGKVKNTGFASYEKGAKAWSRKVRHEKIEVDNRLTPYEVINMIRDGWRKIYFKKGGNGSWHQWILVTVEYPGTSDYYFYSPSKLNLNHDMVITAIDENEGTEFDTPWFVSRIHRRAEATKNTIEIPESIKELIALQDKEQHLYVEIDRLYNEISNLKTSLGEVCERIRELVESDKISGLKWSKYDGWGF